MSLALEILEARKEAAPWNFASNRAASGLTPAATTGFTGGLAKLVSNVAPSLGRQIGFRNVASQYHSTGATGITAPFRNNYTRDDIGGAVPSGNLYMAREKQRAAGLDTGKFDVYGKPKTTLDPRTMPRVDSAPYTPATEILKGRTPEQWHAEQAQAQQQKLKHVADTKTQIEAGTNYMRANAPADVSQMNPDQFKAHYEQQRAGADDLLGRIRAAHGGGSKAACVSFPATEVLFQRCA